MANGKGRAHPNQCSPGKPNQTNLRRTPMLALLGFPSSMHLERHTELLSAGHVQAAKQPSAKIIQSYKNPKS